MESSLIILNSNLSKKTSKFWDKNKEKIEKHFSSAEIFILDVIEPQQKIDLNSYKMIIIIGNDLFFNHVINFFFPCITDQSIAFLPDSNDSSICCGLNYPPRLSKKLELIKSNNYIPLDIIKSHYINKNGLPDSCIILNDILIGIPPLKIPLFFRTIMQWLRSSSIIPFTRSPNHITLVQGEKKLYSGRYLLGLILLGNKITDGPKIRNKNRFNISKFDYFQLNTQIASNMKISLANLFSWVENPKQQNIFHKKINDLEIKAIGNENNIIADGIHIGRLPASFTILPKALNVISPLNVLKLSKPWKNPLGTTADIPSPIGNRDCFREEKLN
jgi:diacylglycerol kinase family enzyme